MQLPGMQLPAAASVIGPQLNQIQRPTAEQLAEIQQQQAQGNRYSDLASQLLAKGQRDHNSWGDVAATLVSAWTATKMQKKADESAADYTKRMLEAQRQQEAFDKQQEREQQRRERETQLADEQRKRQAQREDWAHQYGITRNDKLEDRDALHQNNLEVARIQAQQQAAERAAAPTLAEKEATKHDQKRIADLHQSATSRQGSLKNAQRFRQLIADGKLATGSADKWAGMIPGVWTENQQLNEEFNAFAETAARQALKAAGETRPTDADVKGMKEAMFGVGRDEQTNLNLLDDYIGMMQKDENEYRSARGLEPLPMPGAAGGDLPPQNAQGWQLMTDKNGNRAYVGPNGEIEEV